MKIINHVENKNNNDVINLGFDTRKPKYKIYANFLEAAIFPFHYLCIFLLLNR